MAYLNYLGTETRTEKVFKRQNNMRVENKFSFYCLCVTIQPTKTVADTCQYTKSFAHLTKTITFIFWIKQLFLSYDYQKKSNKKLWFFKGLALPYFSIPTPRIIQRLTVQLALYFFKEMGTDSEMGRKGVGRLRQANDLQKRREAIEKQEANLERIQVNFIVVKWNNNFSLLVTNKVSDGCSS